MNTTNLLGPHSPETQKVLNGAWAASELAAPETAGTVPVVAAVSTGSSPAPNRNLWLSLQQLANDETENAKRASDTYRKGWHAGMACAYRNASVLYHSHRQWEAATVRQPESNAKALRSGGTEGVQ